MVAYWSISTIWFFGRFDGPISTIFRFGPLAYQNWHFSQDKPLTLTCIWWPSRNFFLNKFLAFLPGFFGEKLVFIKCRAGLPQADFLRTSRKQAVLKNIKNVTFKKSLYLQNQILSSPWTMTEKTLFGSF